MLELRAISDSWIVALVFLFLLFVVVIIKTYAYAKVVAITQSFTSMVLFNQHMKEEFFLRNYPSFFLILISCFINAFILSMLFMQSAFYYTFVFFALIGAYLLVKVGLAFTVSKMISKSNHILKQIYCVEILFFQMLGLLAFLLIPLSIVLDKPIVKNVYFALLLIVLVYKLVRFIQISMANNISWFYNILYFCAFEIIPALTLFKFVGEF